MANLAKALCAVQADLKIAKKDKINPFFKSKYADLQTVWDTARELLAKHGLSVTQLPGGDGQRVIVTTVLLHASGEYLADDGLVMVPKDPSPQGVASCVTYARRYGFQCVTGVIADEDDDGEGATRPIARHTSKPADVDAPLASKALPEHAPPVEATVDQVTLMQTLIAVCVAGFRGKDHRDNWAKKHQAEVQSLPEALQDQVRQAFRNAPLGRDRTAAGALAEEAV